MHPVEAIPVRAVPTTPNPETAPLKEERQPQRLPRSYIAAAKGYIFALSSTLIPTVRAQDLVPVDCKIDQGLAQAGKPFNFNNWLNRALCIRRGHVYDQCRVNLEDVLGNLDQVHQTEYGASAGVLALLPTIGALFGSPTSEIWTLMTVLPFGGILAMMNSFGGAIMPSSLSDFTLANDRIMMSDETTEERSKSDMAEHDAEDGEPYDVLAVQRKKLSSMCRKIQSRISQVDKPGLPRTTLVAGIVAMLLLFCGAQISIGIVEAGSVYSNGCTYNWWFHVWYLAVTVASLLDAWANLPFERHWKLYLTGVPYDIEVSGGKAVTVNDSDSISSEPILNLDRKNLVKIRAASLRLTGSTLKTEHRNSVLVIVSVALKQRTTFQNLFPIFTKAANITVFVFGTCVFSAVSLLAMPMAQLVLMLVATAGVGSRSICTGIISLISKSEPMVHVITDNNEDAMAVLTEVFALQERSRTKFQVELQGHVFAEGKRVAMRSRWWRRVLGVMASPYDLRKASGLVGREEERVGLNGSSEGEFEMMGRSER